MSDRGPPILSVEHLGVDRGSRRVLDDIELDIASGDSVAIIGPNGAGKSTLMLAMAGLLPAAAGRVRVQGVDLHEWAGRREIARQIAYVPQQYEGFVGFTVHDIVASARYAHLRRLEPCRGGHLRIIKEALTRCGLEAMQDRVFSTLSGGERQKVHLAAAMAQESPILMLDEPASALDPRHQHELTQLLLELRRSGRTLVVICHDLNLASALEARIVALREGRLIFLGGIEEFFTAGHLHAVFDTEFLQFIGPDGRRRILPRL